MHTSDTGCEVVWNFKLKPFNKVNYFKIACKGDFYDVVCHLIENGADVNLFDDAKNTALIWGSKIKFYFKFKFIKFSQHSFNFWREKNC